MYYCLVQLKSLLYLFNTSLTARQKIYLGKHKREYKSNFPPFFKKRNEVNLNKINHSTLLLNCFYVIDQCVYLSMVRSKVFKSCTTVLVFELPMTQMSCCIFLTQHVMELVPSELSCFVKGGNYYVKNPFNKKQWWDQCVIILILGWETYCMLR